MDKKKKILVGLDIFGLILSVVGVFVLTIMFKIDGRTCQSINNYRN